MNKYLSKVKQFYKQYRIHINYISTLILLSIIALLIGIAMGKSEWKNPTSLNYDSVKTKSQQDSQLSNSSSNGIARIELSDKTIPTLRGLEFGDIELPKLLEEILFTLEDKDVYNPSPSELINHIEYVDASLIGNNLYITANDPTDSIFYIVLVDMSNSRKEKWVYSMPSCQGLIGSIIENDKYVNIESVTCNDEDGKYSTAIELLIDTGAPEVFPPPFSLTPSEIIKVTSTNNSVSINAQKFNVSFKFDPIMGKVSSTFYDDSQCGSEGGFISFSKSDLDLIVNPCGRGGIQYQVVKTIKQKAKSGQEFEVYIHNCKGVKEAYASEEEYKEATASVPDDCRQIELGYITDDFIIEFSADTTSNKQAEFENQIKQIISSMTIELK